MPIRKILQPVAHRALSIVLSAVAVLALGVSGCTSGQAPPVPINEPGSSAWATDSITCKQDTDCQTGEVCSQSVCQMRRCADGSTYKSSPPLGKAGYAMLDRELLVSGGSSSSVQIYAGITGSLVQDTKLANGLALAVSPVDIAGGNLTGARPESVAYVDASNALTIVPPSGSSTQLQLGWAGRLVATGDINGDGIDEILVAGGSQQYAICSAVTNKCDGGTLPADPVDIAVGDVDGDGYAEALFVTGTTVTVLNVNYQTTQEQQFITADIQPSFAYMSSGDLDGDGIAELFGVEGGGIGKGSTDRLYVYDFTSSQLMQQAEFDVGQGTLDVTFASLDNNPRMAVLSNGTNVQVLTYAMGAIASESTATVTADSGSRLAAADVDGNSASVRLKSGPVLQAGPAVPIAVITLPPYSTTHSAGPSSASMGSSADMGTSTSQGMSTAVDLSLSAGVSLNFTIPVVNIGVNFSAYVGKSWAQTASHDHSNSSSLAVGSSYSLSANPYLDGFDSAGVVLAAGCFHQYDYAVDDPAGMMGQPFSNGTMSLFVPVAGQTTFWSSHRYNALAAALGKNQLPIVTIGYKLGDVNSYPRSPVTLAGTPIATTDMVFPNPPVVRTSDVGSLNFSLSASQNQTNSSATSSSSGTTLFVTAGISFFGVGPGLQMSASDNTTLSNSYGVTVGQSTSFSGDVTPVRDDPTTPENESILYGYSFEPLVYRQHFKNLNGQDAAYYVLTYSVSN
jgi:hypothetical protein